MKHNPNPGQRALRKGRVSIENTAYFITTCTADARPIFAAPDAAHIALDSLRWLREAGRVWLLGYVIMPDHVHLVLGLRQGASLSKVMQVWKGFTARSLREKCSVPPPVWQRGYYDHGIRDANDLQIRLDYMHDNPVRKGLVDAPGEYEFSTAHPSRQGDVDAWWMTA